MIQKIELTETINNYISFISIDILKNNITYLKNDTVIKNERLNVGVEQLNDLIKNDVTYWDNQLIDNSIIDGSEVELNISTSDEIFKYHFKNKYPSNYDQFIKNLKVMVNII